MSFLFAFLLFSCFDQELRSCKHKPNKKHRKREREKVDVIESISLVAKRKMCVGGGGGRDVSKKIEA